jgi:RNA polymerase sigma-70 factor (ECF subfamily)
MAREMAVDVLARGADRGEADGTDGAAGNPALPAGWDQASLVRLRADLLRFALLQLRNREMAEDVVQEALAAALSARDKFEHRASLHTFVFSIVKNKIIDVFRDHWHKKRVALPDETEDADEFDILFAQNGMWAASDKPREWGHPETALQDKQFWQVFDVCMNNLSGNAARVFAMREFLGLETDEICQTVGISETNCSVILHRARMSLRLCLQQRWFEGESK